MTIDPTEVQQRIDHAPYGDREAAANHIRVEVGFPDDAPVSCTCTLACIPQGITEEQTCRLQLENAGRRSRHEKT